MITEKPALRVFREELSPINWIERAGDAYADRVAVVDGPVSYTWKEFRDRSRRLASALRSAGIKKGDRIAFLTWNSEPLLLGHFGVPQAGAVLVAINTRLSADEIAYIVEHSGSTMVFHSPELEAQLAGVPDSIRRINLAAGFEDFLAGGSDGPVESWLEDEYETIAIDYTSGTTGRPKGVMYHHRGAYLNAVAMTADLKLDKDSSYLWTLPMFHCNGWTFTWGMAAVGARSICIPKIDPAEVWDLFGRGEVTGFCAAPTVLIMLVNDPHARKLEKPVRLFTAGAPPSPTIIAQMSELGFLLEHVYGLTETYGPYTINVAPAGFAELPADQQARFRARQGFANYLAGEARVVDEEMNDVPADGETMGEIVMRGNNVALGYYRDEAATAAAFAGGWFRSGDLGVMHPDGYVEIRDRAKDMIISGGENISSIEVEHALAAHPDVVEVAVVAVPDDVWGEVPKAYVVVSNGAQLTEEDIREYGRTRLARHKVPKMVEFVDALPKTATGKVQKHVLRDRGAR